MTPKEKAFYLLGVFTSVSEIKDRAKHGAWLCADNILKALPLDDNEPELIKTDNFIYWEQVKREIENL